MNESFKTKINYNESLTNLACSIKKYFELDYNHQTLNYVDDILDEKKPDNVILLLCDGLGSRILNQILDKNSFLIKNRRKEIYSVFPPTTASSLNSIKTGLNPSEHGWIGWTSYIQLIDKIILLYKDKEKGKSEIDEDFINIKKKYFEHKSITDLINDKGKFKSYEISCYPYNVDKDIDSVLNKILEKLKIEGKKYIFAYYPEPDDILHEFGVKSENAKIEIEKINKKIQEFSKKLDKKTIMFIVSDHGHLISPRISIKNSKIQQFMKVDKMFIENRSPSFLIKEDKIEEFKKVFNEEFGNDFYLLSKEEVLKYNIFGEYNKKHELLNSSIGDFLAISKDTSDKSLVDDYDSYNFSSHGGYSDDELFIPLIIISNNN